MHLILALDKNFERLAAVAVTSFLLHSSFESVIIVSPESDKFELLERIAHEFDILFVHQIIQETSSLHRLPKNIQPYFYCIEALDQTLPGRYLYVDADTLCVADVQQLAELILRSNTPIAVCSHGRPMPDRSLILGLESPFHYFNAGVLLFDSEYLKRYLSPRMVVEYYLNHQCLCRFREQCSLNTLLEGHVQFLPGQYNVLSWMRERNSNHQWHDSSVNSMAYCLPDIRQNMKIVHFSNGALPSNVPEGRRESIDHYWLLLEKGINQPAVLPNYSDLW